MRRYVLSSDRQITTEPSGIAAAAAGSTYAVEPLLTGLASTGVVSLSRGH